MLSKKQSEGILQKALDLGADFAELYFEDREDISVNYSETVDNVAHIRLYGVGVYLISGGRGVYVYTNELGERALHDAVVRAAQLLGTSGGNAGVRPLTLRVSLNPCPVATYPGAVGLEQKIALLREAHLAAKAVTPSLRSIQLAYFDRDQRVTIFNSEGVFAEDRRVTSRVRFSPLVSNEAGAISYFSDYCAPAGFETFSSGRHIARMECVIRDMEGSLSAREAPSSRIPVILEGGSCTGTFFHEACGHQLETTELLRGGMFWDRRGEKIATEKVTLIDDGTMSGMYGSSRFDDEGMPRQKNVLIEKGILRSFLVDRLGGVRLNLPRSGSGRRQDYAHAPGARMSNTYLAPGTDDDDEIIRDTKEGLYVTALGGGTGGREFSLMATVAYWIKNGKIDHRVKGAMLLGRGDETMKKIDRVGKTFVTEENGGSFCGAESGFCATTTSGPRMRISEMVVGGKGGTR